MIADAVIGWIIIAVLSLGFYLGVTTLVRFIVKSVDEAACAQREERERIREVLDDEFRDELFWIVEAERAEGEQEKRLS